MRLEFSKWLNEDANISSIPQILANAMKDPFVNAVTPQLAKDLTTFDTNFRQGFKTSDATIECVKNTG